MKTTYCPWFGALATLALLIFFQSSTAQAQGTAFSYQGNLNVNGTPANGSYDMDFTLYTTNVTGVPIAGPVTNAAIAVSNGLFSTSIDFGNAYSGQSNWLEIAVSTNGANAFTTLVPRQQLNPVPYAVTAANLSGVVSAAQLPATVITNGASGVNVSGTFTGNGSGITNVPGTLARVVASGTSISAQPNTAYNLTSSSLVTVSLPSSADVDDVVQVNGTGSGGWQVDARIWTESTSSGTTNLDWTSVASSASGSDLVAVAQNGGIWTSTNSGITWTESTSSGTTSQYWTSVASSANGSNLVAVADSDDDGIWTSTNSGVTWTESTSSGTSRQEWTSVASSSSGSNLVALADAGGIWTSTNSGVTWTNAIYYSSIPLQRWQSVASSASGSNLVAVSAYNPLIWPSSSGTFFRSTNSGVSWTVSTTSGIIGQDWTSVASSADGTHLAAVVPFQSSYLGGTIYGGIWTSTNSGVTWTEQLGAPTSENWCSIASSANGSNLVAVAQPFGDQGGIWMSADSGVTWNESTSSGPTGLDWESVASSASGSNLVAVVDGGGIWTASGGFTKGAFNEGIFNGQAGSSQEFQYLGNGVWQPLTPSPGDNGQGLTNLDASELTSGTVPLAQLPASVVVNYEAGVTLSGTFSGNVSGLNLPSDIITNTETGVTLSGTLSGNGSGLNSISSSALPSNVITNTETGITLSGTFSGNGGGLTSLNAASGLSGTIPQSNVGSTNSFTPIIGNGSANFTTTTQSGNYAKVGNLVYFEAWVVWSSKGSATSGNIVVSLPPVPVASNRAAFNVGYCSGITTAGGPPVAFASQSAANITIGFYSSSGISNVQVANCGSSGELQITGVYRWQ